MVRPDIGPFFLRVRKESKGSRTSRGSFVTFVEVIMSKFQKPELNGGKIEVFGAIHVLIPTVV